MDFRKAVSLITVVCFVFSFIPAQDLRAAVEEGRAVKEFRQILDDFTIPHTIGRLTGARHFGSPTVVVNVQDLHCHPEVQRNISRILSLLDERYRLSRVYVEGAAAGELDTSWLASVADKELRKKVSEALVGRGMLTGMEHYSVLSGKTRLLRGLENEAVYRNNLFRLGRIQEKKSETDAAIARLREDLEGMKEKHFNKHSRSFDRFVSKYRGGHIDAVRYYRELRKYTEKLNRNAYGYGNVSDIDFESYRNIVQYIDLAASGGRLQQKKIARQIRDLMVILKRNLPYDAYDFLLQKTDNFKKLDELYIYLSKITREYGLDLGRNYPQLKEYFSYLEKGQTINPLELMKEEKKLVEQVRIGLSSDESERDVSFLSDFFNYLEDYVDNKLSAEDYEYFAGNFSGFRVLWARYGERNSFGELSGDFKLLDDFCRVNLERNRYFIENIASSSEFRGGQGTSGQAREVIDSLASAREVLVVVAGGFHTRGIEQMLEERNVSYLTITPNVTQDTAVSDAYYADMTKMQARILSQMLAGMPTTRLVNMLETAFSPSSKEDIARLVVPFLLQALVQAPRQEGEEPLTPVQQVARAVDATVKAFNGSSLQKLTGTMKSNSEPGGDGGKVMIKFTFDNAPEIVVEYNAENGSVLLADAAEPEPSAAARGEQNAPLTGQQPAMAAGAKVLEEVAAAAKVNRPSDELFKAALQAIVQEKQDLTEEDYVQAAVNALNAAGTRSDSPRYEIADGKVIKWGAVRNGERKASILGELAEIDGGKGKVFTRRPERAQAGGAVDAEIINALFKARGGSSQTETVRQLAATGALNHFNAMRQTSKNDRPVYELAGGAIIEWSVADEDGRREARVVTVGITDEGITVAEAKDADAREALTPAAGMKTGVSRALFQDEAAKIAALISKPGQAISVKDLSEQQKKQAAVNALNRYAKERGEGPVYALLSDGTIVKGDAPKQDGQRDVQLVELIISDEGTVAEKEGKAAVVTADTVYRAIENDEKAKAQRKYGKETLEDLHRDVAARNEAAVNAKNIYNALAGEPERYELAMNGRVILEVRPSESVVRGRRLETRAVEILDGGAVVAAIVNEVPEAAQLFAVLLQAADPLRATGLVNTIIGSVTGIDRFMETNTIKPGMGTVFHVTPSVDDDVLRTAAEATAQGNNNMIVSVMTPREKESLEREGIRRVILGTVQVPLGREQGAMTEVTVSVAVKNAEIYGFNQPVAVVYLEPAAGAAPAEISGASDDNAKAETMLLLGLGAREAMKLVSGSGHIKNDVLGKLYRQNKVMGNVNPAQVRFTPGAVVMHGILSSLANPAVLATDAVNDALFRSTAFAFKAGENDAANTLANESVTVPSTDDSGNQRPLILTASPLKTQGSAGTVVDVTPDAVRDRADVVIGRDAMGTELMDTVYQSTIIKHAEAVARGMGVILSITGAQLADTGQSLLRKINEVAAIDGGVIHLGIFSAAKGEPAPQVNMPQIKEAVDLAHSLGKKVTRDFKVEALTDESREQIVQWLVAGADGVRFDGAELDLSKLSDASPAQIEQWLNEFRTGVPEDTLLMVKLPANKELPQAFKEKNTGPKMFILKPFTAGEGTAIPGQEDECIDVLLSNMIDNSGLKNALENMRSISNARLVRIDLNAVIDNRKPGDSGAENKASYTANLVLAREIMNILGVQGLGSAEDLYQFEKNTALSVPEKHIPASDALIDLVVRLAAGRLQAATASGRTDQASYAAVTEMLDTVFPTVAAREGLANLSEGDIVVTRDSALVVTKNEKNDALEAVGINDAGEVVRISLERLRQRPENVREVYYSGANLDAVLGYFGEKDVVEHLGAIRDKGGTEASSLAQLDGFFDAVLSPRLAGVMADRNPVVWGEMKQLAEKGKMMSSVNLKAETAIKLFAFVEGIAESIMVKDNLSSGNKAGFTDPDSAKAFGQVLLKLARSINKGTLVESASTDKATLMHVYLILNRADKADELVGGDKGLVAAIGSLLKDMGTMAPGERTGLFRMVEAAASYTRKTGKSVLPVEIITAVIGAPQSSGIEEVSRYNMLKSLEAIGEVRDVDAMFGGEEKVRGMLESIAVDQLTTPGDVLSYVEATVRFGQFSYEKTSDILGGSLAKLQVMAKSGDRPLALSASARILDVLSDRKESKPKDKIKDTMDTRKVLQILGAA